MQEITLFILVYFLLKNYLSLLLNILIYIRLDISLIYIENRLLLALESFEYN